MIKAVKIKVAILFIMLVSAITACGKGEVAGEIVSQTELKGTVAIGEPIAAEVSIVDAEGFVYNTSSDESGKYAIEMRAAKGPFLIKITPDDDNYPVLFTYSTGVGIANATQFTSLVLILAKDTDLEAAFEGWGTTINAWSSQDIKKAMAVINANFSENLTDLGQDPYIFDMFTTAFDANGVGVDAFLDEFAVEINYSDNTYAVTNANEENVSINRNINTTGYYIGAAFAPDEDAEWLVTLSTTLDGVNEPLKRNFTIATNKVPFSRSAFIEDSWSEIGEVSESRTISDTEGTITIEVTGYAPSYKVSGNGGVGTVINTSLSFGYRAYGTVNGQSIDERATFRFDAVYKRKK